LLNCAVDVLGGHVELLGDALVGLEISLVDRVLQRARSDDEQGSLPGADPLVGASSPLAAPAALED
jgi:hypothetical protein